MVQTSTKMLCVVTISPYLTREGVPTSRMKNGFLTVSENVA